ncbi:MAG: S8 family serine peptidase [Actinomycetota bacterium]|nr:S8 family serine peptidase [Actinomycetota bacterium]
MGSRSRTYLIARDERIWPAAAGPLEFGWLLEQLDDDPAVDVQRRLSPRQFSPALAGSSLVQEVMVASMPASKAAELVRHPQVVLEEDHVVLPQPVGAPATVELLPADPATLRPFGTSAEWELHVQSFDGTPVSGAAVYLYGEGVPAQGRTDDQGRVVLQLLDGADGTLRALYVNPQRDYWSLWVDRPSLTSGGDNTVIIQPLSQTFAGFPSRQMFGWGQLAMRLDQVPGEMDGRGVRVAVVDSGAAATTHPDLSGTRAGVDLTEDPANTVRWTVDTIAHGSHCTGVIAGTDSATGIRGFAPAAEVHQARIFPGGRVSSLLDAIDYCVAQEMDVVNMSLGTGGTSQIVLQKLAQARAEGVACIVAAGNSGGSVQFPGSSPDVLTVAAIGLDGQFPDNSYHAQQRWRQGTTDHGFFSAQFSCHGPEVDVSAPGVAVVSSVPTDGFAAWDGTSMAAPHVAGLAALILAHHRDFQTPALKLRTAARVDRLFEILRASASPLDLGDATRSGAGMPDAIRALELAGSPTSTPPDEASRTSAVRAGLAQIRAELVAAGLLPGQETRTQRPGGLLHDLPSSASHLRRELAELQAQMQAAGLIPAGSALV